jgi:hypothetical protein
MKVFILAALLSISACGPKPIPEFNRPIFSLDNRDPKNIVLRYKNNQIVIDIADVRARGGVFFLPDDFTEFARIYVAGCKEWDSSIKLKMSDKVIKDSGLKK